MDKRGKISALIERLRVYRFEIDGEEINAGDVMQKLVDAASEPIDQHMLNDLFDFIEEVAAGEHSMDGAVREIARKAATIRGPVFRSGRAADDLRERVARAMTAHHTIPWEKMPDMRKRRLLAYADEALAEIGGVRVSPLVWTAKGYAQTPFGKYLVVREDWSGQEDFWFVCFAGKPYGQCGEHSSEEAAKAAAQADYEARILAAIEPAPVSVREAARVLLDECKDGEVWRMYVNAMMPVLNADLSADSWNTVDEIRAAFAAALRAIAEGEDDE